ncbi:ABC transporter substrate-binding protein [Anaeromicropila herbilytica]|uniref:ABC transporter substrate-binding protein n=1 Tax=Anaeromicropila herbilytica TaxID=2785025 RepID=A0A7R7IAT2_9FIRM|nr:ABC transporter substrate-binding protein [Anaeromicropila herbilytica]BCN28788.1 ABC transporter substrate-binding protein [Anaeromicropila herbilytica]
MKQLKKLILVLCMATLALGLVACAKDNKENKVSQTAKPTNSPEVTKYPVTVKDSDGKEVTLDKEPTKVVSMAPNITELIYKLGVESKLVGRTDYCDYPEEVKNVESVGTLTEPNIEKITSLQPDIVIASTHFSEETEKQLADLGIKVVVLYEEHDIEGVYTMIQTLGTMFNVNDKATNLVSDMKTSIDETKKAVKGLETPSVYYVVGFGEYGDYTAGGDTFIGQLITLAGGKNIAADVKGWSYSLESLMEADPDIIIVPNDMKDSFMKATNYKDLTAVKNNRVYGIDKNILERQGYRNAEGLATIAKIFHPEAFK